MGVPIPNYPDYLIETDGRIFSLKTNKWMKVQLGNNGYYGLELSNKEGHKRLSLHRLLAITFIPNPDNLPIINHKDENKLNNDLSNLEWCSHKYNLNYGSVTERRVAHTDYTKSIYKEIAIKNSKKMQKAVARYTLDGTYIDSFESATEASRILGFKSNHICDCCKLKRASSNGYIWRYKEKGGE